MSASEQMAMSPEAKMEMVAAPTADLIRYYSRSSPRRRRVRFVEKRDIGAVLRISLYCASAYCLPAALWPLIVKWAPKRRGRGARRRVEAAMRSYFGDTKSPSELEELSARHREAVARQLMIVAAELVGRWKPRVSIRGEQALAAALEKGHGAILWCDPFLFQSIVGKKGLFEAGFRGHQVSVYEHGYLRSKIGRRLLNARQQAIEMRYATRVEFDARESGDIGVRIQNLLRNNQLVLITNNVYSGKRFAELRFGAEGRLRLATGPLAVAMKVCAPILPYAMFEVSPFRRYEGVVGEQLRIDKERCTIAPEQAFEEALLQYRAWLEGHVRRHPEQWRRWLSIRPRARSATQVEQP
jgi:lauroyl/myristoyl acyltransferase